MKFPESWLREHVPLDADRATLAATLTAIGLEVEAVNEIGGNLDGVVVAQGRHADLLRDVPDYRAVVTREEVAPA